MGHNFNDIAKDAEQGNSDAQFKLGLRYFKGDGVEKDFVQAFSWYKKAAIQGHDYAQCHLGLCFANGFGVTKDSVQAFSWFKKSAVQGCAEAEYFLGLCYKQGESGWLLRRRGSESRHRTRWPHRG